MSPLSDRPEIGGNDNQIEKKTLQHSPDNTVVHQEPKDTFEAVLNQIKFDQIATLASSIRRAHELKDNTVVPDLSSINCKILKRPCRGSYNLVYRIKFDDGIQWTLKILRDGQLRCWGAMASEALTSEALTVRMISKQKPAIPVSAVYHFDASMANEMECPYIVMDWLQRKPLWEAWYQNDISHSMQQQIRLRALQTIAAAMVELSDIRFDKAGSLRFDSDGNFVEIGEHKAADLHLAASRAEAAPVSADDLYCTKKPSIDPLSWILDMFNPRGIKADDTALEKGRNESIRMLTNWASGVFEDAKLDSDQCVLAHPDLDTQNILVKADGTLCGILDWDRVCAVPESIGALKYPLWLTRDWLPSVYNYALETEGPKVPGRRNDGSPDELAHYRFVYAQTIESVLLNRTKDAKASKRASNITRLSLILGNLEHAVDSPWFTVDIMANSFEQMNAAVEEMGYETDSGDEDSDEDEEEEEDDEDDEDEVGIEEDEADDENDIKIAQAGHLPENMADAGNGRHESLP